jgi:hypothetical protein
MTTTQARNAILDRIGDCDYRIAQAAAEGLVLRGERQTYQDAALERAGELALAALLMESRRMAERARGE